MSVTIELSPEQEASIRSLASKGGQTMEEFFLDLAAEAEIRSEDAEQVGERNDTEYLMGDPRYAEELRKGMVDRSENVQFDSLEDLKDALGITS